MDSSTSSNSESLEINRLLQLGIQAARAGQREQARELLFQVVEQDQENIAGWLWLSGVLDNPEERRICLENVLRLDPENTMAHKGLSLLRQQPTAGPVQRPAPPAPAEPKPPLQLKPEPPRRAVSSAYKRLKPVSPVQKAPAAPPAKSRSPSVSVSTKVPQPESATPAKALPVAGRERTAFLNIFTDAYQCPYCARQTKPKDERCPACQNKLWYHLPHKDETSGLYKFILGLQILNLLLAAWSAGFLTKVISEVIIKDDSTATLIFSGLIEALVFGYQAVVLIGFYKRWRIIYYLYLCWAILNGVAAIPIALVMGIMGLSGFFFGVLIFLVSVVQFFLVMSLGEDFTFDKHRFLLRIDPSLHTGPDLLSRGGHYSQRKMWALAAAYFHQAGIQMPGNIKAHLALGFAYFNLKQFDLAEMALARARKIDPASPLVKELEADLQAQHSS